MSEELARISEPMRSKTNRDLLARVFTRLGWACYMYLHLILIGSWRCLRLLWLARIIPVRHSFESRSTVKLWGIAIGNHLKFVRVREFGACQIVFQNASNGLVNYKHLNGCLTYLWLCNHRIVIHVTSNALVRGLVRRLKMFDFNLADDFVCGHITDGIDAGIVLVPRDFG